jgi:putative alpha-1,2-mannosidase
MSKKDDAAILSARAANFSLMFDSSSGLFRSRDIATQKFTEPFDEYAWGGDYTEGGPMQYRFYVPFSPSGLSSLYSQNGKDMCAEFEKGQTDTLSTFHVGGYIDEIHEQTELPLHCWGQYAHNNQPVHHMLYMFIDSPCRSKAEFYIRKTLLSLYKPGADMFPGDEDNGEMGAWFVLSAIGLYNLSPGSGYYVLGAPLFEQVTVTLPEGKTLVIKASNNMKENPYVKSITFNGVHVAGKNQLPYKSLIHGGTLQFEMSNEPPGQINKRLRG